MNKNCIVCDSSKFEKIYDDTLLKCPTCTFVTANMDIDEAVLESVYTENYFNGEEYMDYVAEKNSLQNNFIRRIKKIKTIVSEKNISNILEIGCAYGFFGDVVKHELKSAVYYGVDVVQEAIDYAKDNLNLNVDQANYLNLQLDTKYTDVFMWDVIEHLERPDLFLEKINSELVNGGRVYITTGDINSKLSKFQGASWRMIHPPSHLQYFSKPSISKLLQKYGFEVTDISYAPVYRNLRSIIYLLFNKRISESVIEKIIPFNFSIPINTYDIMFVIATKKD